MDQMIPSNSTDPNDSKRGPAEFLMNPLLLAAYYGNSEVLKAILQFYNANEKEMKPYLCSSNQYRRSISKKVVSDSLLNAYTEDTKENILHLVLKGPYTSNSQVSNLELYIILGLPSK